MSEPPSRADIESTAVRMRGKVRRTPVLELHGDELGPVPVEVGGVAVDSLGAGTVGSLALACAKTAGVEVPLVVDDDIVSARKWLWERCRVLAEPGACVPLAALMAGATLVHPGDTVVVVVSGGNDPRIP